MWVAQGRPFVTYKAAVTVDGRLAASPGDSRWVSGEASRRLVHELRAASDAVAVGMGTVRADEPAPDRPRRGGRPPAEAAGVRPRPAPEGSELELCSGPLEDELARLAGEGVQSLLLEGGPTLAGAFLRAGLVDKLLLFVAPKLVGGDDAPALFAGPGAPDMADALPVSRLEATRVGEDILLTAYVHEPRSNILAACSRASSARSAAVESLERRRDGRPAAGRARPETAAATAVGDSVSISGACLTAVEVAGGVLAFDAVPETLSPYLARRSRGRRAGERRARAPRRASRSEATSCRATSTASGRRARRGRGPGEAPRRRDRAGARPATASRRARSRSTASA